MNQKQQPLTRDLHLRVSESFEAKLHEIANHHNLKPSTFSRYVLMRHLQDYLPNAAS